MISVIVPILNEAENIPPLLQEIAAAGAGAPIREIIFVDDGSTDNSVAILKQLKQSYPALRILRHGTRSGQSAALWTGIKAASQELIVTLDGDGQNDPRDIPLLYTQYQKQQGETPRYLIAGERAKRNDNWVRRLSSRIANNVRSSLLNDGTRDTGCSLKLFRREDYLSLPYFNHMHRFIPALMIRDGARVAHVPVSHRPRARGVSKYGTVDRLIAGLSDLAGVMWLMHRAHSRPGATEE